MKNNFDYLIEQFKKAKDIKTSDIYSKSFVTEFSYWLKQREIIGQEYINYLDNLELDYKSSRCAEVGKGEHDTLVKPFETKIISSNVNDITEVNSDRLIKGMVKFRDGSAFLCTGKKDSLNYSRISNLEISTFMIQNPYSYKMVSGIADVHNKGTHNIIIGAYGSLYDKDKYKKVEQLKLIKAQLNNDFIEEYDTFDDSYYYIIGSLSDKKRNK